MTRTADCPDPFERALDAALEMTFPASDPIAPAMPARHHDSTAGNALARKHEIDAPA